MLTSEGRRPSRGATIAQAIFVTFLWSTSWVLIVTVLRGSLPALTFAGLRYMLAFLCLVPLTLFQASGRRAVSDLTRRQWAQLALLGLLVYALTQGAQFVSLALLPANTVSLVLNLTPVAVALVAGTLLSERSSPVQWLGIGIASAGVLIYFVPFAGLSTNASGLAAAALCMLGNAASSVFGRLVNRQTALPALVVTTVSMGFGAAVLLVVGLAVQGLTPVGLLQWGIIAWLAFVNTAFAFTLWNNTLRSLSAVESSIINSLMLPQTVGLAVVFLGEALTSLKVAGLVLVGLGALIVQLRPAGIAARRRPSAASGQARLEAKQEET